MGKKPKENKDPVNEMFEHLKERLGEYNAGLLLAILCDLLDEFTKDVESRELRTIELVLNDFFSAKYDFDKNKMVEAKI